MKTRSSFRSPRWLVLPLISLAALLAFGHDDRFGGTPRSAQPFRSLAPAIAPAVAAAIDRTERTVLASVERLTAVPTPPTHSGSSNLPANVPMHRQPEAPPP